jgi:hypothetical protein
VSPFRQSTPRRPNDTTMNVSSVAAQLLESFAQIGSLLRQCDRDGSG